MALRPLLSALKAFPADKMSFLPLFGKLTLKDLGFYVEDVHAMKYFEDANYPLANHAFLLENALNQTCFVAGSDRESEASFFPVEWKNKATDRVGCSTLFGNDQVTLCWFVVPPGGVMPLHDHPTMSVWQRVLFGKLRITSIDWAQPAGTPAPTENAAILSAARERAENGGEGVVVFCDTVDGSEAPVAESRLDLDVGHFSPLSGGGTLHELENIDPHRPAFFIDVIAPPYMCPPSTLLCSYYNMHRKEGGGAGADRTLDLPRSAAHPTRGIKQSVAKGDRVVLTPIKDFYGPDMNAFAHLSDE